MQIADLYRDRQMCPTGGVTREYHRQCATIHSTPFIINITNMNIPYIQLPRLVRMTVLTFLPTNLMFYIVYCVLRLQFVRRLIN